MTRTLIREIRAGGPIHTTWEVWPLETPSFSQLSAMSGRKAAAIVALEGQTGNIQLQLIRFLHWHAGPSVLGQQKPRKVWFQHGRAVAGGCLLGAIPCSATPECAESIEERTHRSIMLHFDSGEGVPGTMSGLTVTLFASYHSTRRFSSPELCASFRTGPHCGILLY
jgi:hypothetical protein